MWTKIVKKKYSRFTNDVILTFITQIIIMFCGFMINKVLSNTLSIEGYGTYNIIKKSSAVLAFTMLSGMGIALPRYLACYKSRNEQKTLPYIIYGAGILVICISFIVFIVGIIWQKELARLIVGDNEEVYLIVLMYSFLLAGSTFSYAYYRGVGEYKKFSISQTLVQLALGISVCFINRNINAIYFAWSLIIFSFLIIFLSLEKKKNYNVLSGRFCYQELYRISRKLAVYGIPRMFGDFILFSFAAYPLIWLSSRESLVSSSYFSIGITLVSMVLPLYSFLGMVLLPHITSMVANKEYKKAEKLVFRLFLIYMISAVFIIGISYFFMNFIISFFFAPDYLISLPLCRIIIFAVLFEALYLLYRNPIDAVSAFPYNTFLLGLGLVTMIILFRYCTTLTEYAMAYLIVSATKGIGAVSVWMYLKKHWN